MTNANKTEIAIAQSIEQNEIVTLDWTAEAETALDGQCDDSVTYPGEYGSTIREYWGQDDDGQSWRVHLRTAETTDKS